MRKLLSILLLVFCSLCFANSEHLEKEGRLFAEDSWDFLETQFIKNPQLETSSISNTSIKLLCTAIPAMYIYLFSWIGCASLASLMIRGEINPNAKSGNEMEVLSSRLCFAIGTLSSCLPTYCISPLIFDKIHNYLLKKIEETNLKTFIENWPTNKLITPKQFHDDFENLYSEFNKESTTLDINKVNLLLKKAIRRHFL